MGERGEEEEEEVGGGQEEVEQKTRGGRGHGASQAEYQNLGLLSSFMMNNLRNLFLEEQNVFAHLFPQP